MNPLLHHRVLWNGGISLGGVVPCLFADLILLGTFCTTWLDIA